MKLNISSKFLKLLAPTILIIFSVLGLFIYKDYGISWDEYIQRTIAIKNIKYLIEFFNLNFVFNKLEKI